ncbi:MAG: F0F1 ATP synthase subunit epsilon [Deltaproteobacteria bacterium]|nr:F0F1 ATP synthase subunit epsilon [Deltaproteobacteria bacterium]MCL5791923.1 F0F1 ATP synthase subunit epsilon [Deltaproteobacteria bacterium]
MSIRLKIITPEKTIIDQDVDEVVAPGYYGEFGILPGHARYITILKIGELTYRSAADEKCLAINWGYADINQKKMTVLVETAEFEHEIDYNRALDAKQRAEEELKHLTPIDAQYVAAISALERAAIRLRVSNRYRSKSSNRTISYNK